MTVDILTSLRLMLAAIAIIIVAGHSYPTLIRSLSVKSQLRWRRCAIGILGCIFGYIAMAAILPLGRGSPNGLLEQCFSFFGVLVGFSMAWFSANEAAKMRSIVVLCSGYSEVSLRRNARLGLKKLLGPCEVILLESTESMGIHSRPLWLHLLVNMIWSSDYHSGGAHLYPPINRKWRDVAKEMMCIADLIVFSSENEFNGVRVERDIVNADSELLRKAAIIDAWGNSKVLLLRELSSNEVLRQLPMFSRPKTILYAVAWLAGILADGGSVPLPL